MKPDTKTRRCDVTKELEAFFFSDEARGIRLQTDYEKAEVRLKQAGVEHTVVVFGSARIVSEEEAKKHLQELETQKALSKDDPRFLRRYRAARAALEKSRYYEEARRFGRLVGLSGNGPKDTRLTLMTGGGPGIMEAANRGAYEVGAKSIGLNIRLPREQHPNPYVTPELSFSFYYFGIRKLHFMQRAKAMVVFPGGFGTLDELFDILTLVQTGKNPSIPVVLVSKTYWQRIIDWGFLVQEGMIGKEDTVLFEYADDAQDAWERILSFYARRNEPLL